MFFRFLDFDVILVKSISDNYIEHVYLSNRALSHPILHIDDQIVCSLCLLFKILLLSWFQPPVLALIRW